MSMNKCSWLILMMAAVAGMTNDALARPTHCNGRNSTCEQVIACYIADAVLTATENTRNINYESIVADAIQNYSGDGKVCTGFLDKNLTDITDASLLNDTSKNLKMNVNWRQVRASINKNSISGGGNNGGGSDGGNNGGSGGGSGGGNIPEPSEPSYDEDVTFDI